MSGSEPAGLTAEQEALVAEYVIGTLEAWQSRVFERTMEMDPALRAAVERLEADLAPLAALAPAEQPPAELWDRIDRAVDRISAPDVGTASPGAISPGAISNVVPLRRRQRVVQAWAVGASLAAAAFAAVALLPRTEPQRIMTVMVSDRSQSAVIAEFGPGGGIRLASIPPVGAQPGQVLPPVPGDRVQELWVLPPGASAPTSLGLLPSQAGREVRVTAPAVRPVVGMLIEITLEPPGGSPTGRPTGPVQFIGRLVEAASS